MKINPFFTHAKESPNFKKWVYGSESSSSSVYRDSSPDTFEYSSESSSYPTMDWVQVYDEYFDDKKMIPEDLDKLKDKISDWDFWIKYEAINRVNYVNEMHHVPSGIPSDFYEYMPAITIYTNKCKIEKIKQELEKLDECLEKDKYQKSE